MSKRTKATVDYFPHIIKKGKTIFILESKFGNDGYAFWFKLLELLGDNEGHYIDCNDPSTWEYLLAYIRVDEETVNKIIEVLIELGNIDKELWEHKILFCQNFIDNIGDVYKRRIIEKPTKEAICQQLGIVLTVKCIQLPTSNGINVDICPQSKVKESKVKESKDKERERQASDINEIKKEIDPLEFSFTDKCWYNLDDWRIKMYQGKYPNLTINYLLQDVYKGKFLSDPLRYKKEIAIAGGVEKLVWMWLGQDEKYRRRKEKGG